MNQTRSSLLRCVAAILVASSPIGPSVAQEHWSFQPIRRPSLPALGGSRHGHWARNPIDHFILTAQRREGLLPSSGADPESLIRRLTLDLTGVPPTWEEVEAFKSAPAPDAYERLTRRLLASPKYGEQMAVPWLDLARYADTHGYHMDAHRDMWRWRDWLIGALNQGMPFNQFTVEQLAGDLLPNATLAQQIATGFHRNHMINFEDGSIAEEFRTEYVADRTETTATVWLGLTIGCCRCHDHRYDPLSQDDFFRLFAFFNNVPENGIDGDQGNAEPTILAPTDDQLGRMERIDAQIDALTLRLRGREQEVDADIETWATERLSDGPERPLPPVATRQLHLDGPSQDRELMRVMGEPVWLRDGQRKSLLLDGRTHLELAGVLDQEEAVTLSAWIFPTTPDAMNLFSKARTGPHARGFRLMLREGVLELSVFNQPRGSELRVASAERIDLRNWHHIAVVIDGTGRAAGVGLFVDGKPQQTRVLADTLRQAVLTSAPLTVAGPDPSFRGMLDDVRVFDRPLEVSEVTQLAGNDPLDDVLAISASDRSDDQRAWLRRYYLANVDSEYAKFSNRLSQAKRAKRRLGKLIPSVMVMKDSRPRQTFVLEGGRYDLRSVPVSPATPAVLSDLAADLPRNRLGLALWITDPSNPLTARVTVNRLWQHHFGRGLVATADDFGTQGSPPTHPLLLDWLSAELIQSGWNVKYIQYLIVTSSTYRQSSHMTTTVRERDPDNLWLSRMPRSRLPAEAIRDSVLAISELLVERLGGPSVFPYQPAGLWKELAYDPDEFTAQAFVRSKGGDLYRRSLYTFYKRSVPPPNMEAFDTPNREKCVVTRATTVTPSQALVLMNDVTFVEAARVFAGQVMRQAGTLRDRMLFAHRRVLGRTPDDDEIQILSELWRDQRDAFRKSIRSAHELLAVGDASSADDVAAPDLAAWTAVVSVLIETDEFIVRP